MKQGAFEKFYLLGYESKGVAGLYFSAFVLLYFLLGGITVGTDISLGFWHCIQMAIACIFIGVCQRIIIPRELLSVGRCLIWGACASVITVGFAVGFGWYDVFPLWCGIMFCVVMPVGYMALWPAFYWQSKRETQQLNEKLKAFQSRKGEAE